jgi:4-aminobutyrate aminotransferase/(S)-3-amino-2-methylpropionate transaminase
MKSFFNKILRIDLDTKTFKEKILSDSVYETYWGKGLLMISAGTYSNIIRPLMPLTITDEQLKRGLCIVEETLDKLSL